MNMADKLEWTCQKAVVACVKVLYLLICFWRASGKPQKAVRASDVQLSAPKTNKACWRATWKGQWKAIWWYTVLCKYSRQTSQYPKCAVRSCMFDGDSFYVFVGFIMNTVIRAILYPVLKIYLIQKCREHKIWSAFLLFGFHSVRCSVRWAWDSIVDGPRTTPDVTVVWRRSIWAVIWPVKCCCIRSKFIRLWFVYFNAALVYYYESNVQNSMALRTCDQEEPFRILHGTQTIFTNVFRGFTQSFKANFGISL
jgi:hypothetical protein